MAIVAIITIVLTAGTILLFISGHCRMAKVLSIQPEQQPTPQLVDRIIPCNPLALAWSIAMTLSPADRVALAKSLLDFCLKHDRAVAEARQGQQAA